MQFALLERYPHTFSLSVSTHHTSILMLQRHSVALEDFQVWKSCPREAAFCLTRCPTIKFLPFSRLLVSRSMAQGQWSRSRLWTACPCQLATVKKQLSQTRKFPPEAGGFCSWNSAQEFLTYFVSCLWAGARHPVCEAPELPARRVHSYTRQSASWVMTVRHVAMSRAT